MALEKRDLVPFAAGAAISALWFLLGGSRVSGAKTAVSQSLPVSPGQVAVRTPELNGSPAIPPGPDPAKPAPAVLQEGATLTLAMKRDHGLSQEQAIRIQEVLKRTQKELVEHMTGKIRRQSGNDGSALLLEADPEFGDRLSDELEKELTEISGRNVSQRILTALREENSFLKMGREDLSFRIQPSHPDEIFRIEYEYRDPATGAFGGSGNAPLRQFNAELLGYFEKNAE